MTTARRREDLKDLSEPGCATLPLDVTDQASLTAAVAETGRYRMVDMLVNDSGYAEMGRSSSFPSRLEN